MLSGGADKVADRFLLEFSGLQVVEVVTALTLWRLEPILPGGQSTARI